MSAVLCLFPAAPRWRAPPPVRGSWRRTALRCPSWRRATPGGSRPANARHAGATRPLPAPARPFRVAFPSTPSFSFLPFSAATRTAPPQRLLRSLLRPRRVPRSHAAPRAASAPPRTSPVVTPLVLLFLFLNKITCIMLEFPCIIECLKYPAST
jgi:hypothetical protein